MEWFTTLLTLITIGAIIIVVAFVVVFILICLGEAYLIIKEKIALRIGREIQSIIEEDHY